MFEVVNERDQTGRPTGRFVVLNPNGQKVHGPCSQAEAIKFAHIENAKLQMPHEPEPDRGPSMGW